MPITTENFLNKTIVLVRYMTDEEQKAFNWNKKSIVFQLNDGTLFFPSVDEEGNDAGALHYFMQGGEKSGVIPAI